MPVNSFEMPRHDAERLANNRRPRSTNRTRENPRNRVCCRFCFMFWFKNRWFHGSWNTSTASSMVFKFILWKMYENFSKTATVVTLSIQTTIGRNVDIGRGTKTLWLWAIWRGWEVAKIIAKSAAVSNIPCSDSTCCFGLVWFLLIFNWLISVDRLLRLDAGRLDADRQESV